MNVIITGAGGLLGRQLTMEARRSGHRVIGVGRAAHAPAGWTGDRWIAGNLADPRLRERDWQMLAGAAVFHLAAETRIYDAGMNFERDNVAATETACAMVQQTGGRLIFFSSSAVYSGPHTQRPVAALTETDETNPATAYGRSKRAAEELISESGIDAVVLRVFGVLSDRLPEVSDRGNLIQAIRRAGSTGGEVVVAVDRDGESAVRDYVFDEDICRCALDALAWPRPARGALLVNVCTGEGTSALEMVEIARQLTGKSIKVRLDSTPTATNPVMLGDPSELRRRRKSVPENRVREFWERMVSNPARAP